MIAFGPGRPAVGFHAPNGELLPIRPGTPVAVPPPGMARRAIATMEPLSRALGIATTLAAPTLPVYVVTAGPVQLEAATWDLVTGGSGGLVPGETYYLDVTAGMLTVAAPVGIGAYVVLIGEAITETLMTVSPSAPLLL